MITGGCDGGGGEGPHRALGRAGGAEEIPKADKELKNPASWLPSQFAFPNRATLLRKLVVIVKNTQEPVVAPYSPNSGEATSM